MGQSEVRSGGGVSRAFVACGHPRASLAQLHKVKKKSVFVYKNSKTSRRIESTRYKYEFDSWKKKKSLREIMSKDKCCVPSCKYRRTRYPEIGRRSLFRCPKDPEYAQEWCDNIPGIEVLKPNDHVCDIHFEDRFIYQTRQVGTNTRVSFFRIFSF